MNKPFFVKVYRVIQMADAEITTCDNADDARKAATLMAQEGILNFEKADINFISISFNKEEQRR